MSAQLTVQKLEKLKKKHIDWEPGSQQILDQAERELRRAIVTKKISEMPEIKKILVQYKKAIEEIDIVLTQDRKATDQERQILFIKKDLFTIFIEPFGIADQTIEQIEVEVDEQLDEDDK